MSGAGVFFPTLNTPKKHWILSPLDFKANHDSANSSKMSRRVTELLCQVATNVN